MNDELFDRNLHKWHEKNGSMLRDFRLADGIEVIVGCYERYGRRELFVIFEGHKTKTCHVYYVSHTLPPDCYIDHKECSLEQFVDYLRSSSEEAMLFYLWNLI